MLPFCRQCGAWYFVNIGMSWRVLMIPLPPYGNDNRNVDSDNNATNLNGAATMFVIGVAIIA